MAAAGPGAVIEAWGRLGYPRRALRLREAAAAVVERHGGVVPRDVAQLEALPGIGTYTAGAKHRYRFTVALDSSADNAYQGDSATVGFDFNAA